MEDTREKLRRIIESNLCIEFTDHNSLTNPDKFKGTLKLVNGTIDSVIDQIIETLKKPS